MRIFFNYVEAAALVFMAMTISSNSTAFTREDVTDRSKPIWTDFTIRLYSPYFAQTPFRGLNGALCTFGRSDYKDFTNFKAVEGGEPSAAYLAYLDDSLCGQTTDNQLYIFRAEQDTSNSPLTVESWQRSSVGVLGPDDRAKVVLEEETSAANPYGIMDVARNIIHKNGGHIYSWSSSSKRLNDGRIQYKQIAWVDLYLLGSQIPQGIISDLYSSNIVHSEDGTGYGSVTARRGRGQLDGSPPVVFLIMDMAYTDDLMLFKQVGGSDTCLSRQSKWEYVQQDGYGIYDAAGGLTDQFGTYTYDNDGELEEFPVVPTGTGGALVLINPALRSLEDGQPVPEGSLNSDYFPRFSLPDGAIVTGPDQQEHLVRVLRPTTAYAYLDTARCAERGLILNTSLQTPDHNMINRLSGDIPSVGALLVNDFVPGDSIGDPLYSGTVYAADEDEDEDGVANYKDAFPLDPLKTTDSDHDGVDDAEDNEILQSAVPVPEYTHVMPRDPEEGTADF